MRDDTEQTNPRLPIGGAGGALILSALKRLQLHAGDISITITKRRTAGGGYAYAITHRESAGNEGVDNHG